MKAAASIPTSPKAPQPKWQVWGVCVFLVLAVGAVFGQSAGFGFINYDDQVYVYENQIVQNGLTWPGVLWAFGYGEIGHWHPLTWLSHMADCQMFGLWAGGPHLENVVLHAVSTVLLFLLLRSMTGSLWRSAFVAAFFAVHPLRAESVAWIAERKDVLGATFFMLTLWAYVRYVRRPSRRRYAGVAMLYCLGLLSKNMLVTTPFVLLLLDGWPLGRMSLAFAKANKAGEPLGFPIWALVKEKIPLFLLSAASCVATVLVPEKNEVHLTLLNRVGDAFLWYAAYLREIVFPVRLALPYLFPSNGLPFWKIGLSAAALIGVSAVAARSCRKRPYLLMGWLWFLGMLVPVIGLVQISYYTHADRYTYLPSIGLSIAGTWAAADLSANWKYRRAILAGLMALVLGTLAAMGYTQTSYWCDSETLWKRVLACTTDNTVAYYNLGAAYAMKDENKLAIPQYRKALEIRPDYAEARNNLGTALYEVGEKDEAIAQFRKAIELNSDYAEARGHLAVALFARGEKAEAIAQYRKALELKPDNAEARSNLGIALFDKGEPQEAIAQYRQALEIDPRYVKAEYNLANALASGGQLEEAIPHFRKAIAIKPDYALAHYGMAAAWSGREDWAQAIAEYHKALELKPDFAEARRGLGKSLIRNGDFDAAATCFRMAAATPDSLTRWRKLGDDFLQTGELDEAVATYRHALKITPNSAETSASLGLALFQKGDRKGAMDAWQHSLDVAPEQPSVQNNLAWLLATAPNPSLRNGAKAVALAEKASQLSGGGNPFVLHTLAAAYAETGRFADATATARRALDLTETQQNAGLAAKLEKEIILYRANTPVRDIPQ